MKKEAPVVVPWKKAETDQTPAFLPPAGSEPAAPPPPPGPQTPAPAPVPPSPVPAAPAPSGGNALITTIVGVALALILLVAAGAAGTVFFQSHAKPGAQLADQDITGFSRSQVHNVAATLIDHYQVTLELGDKQVEASAEDLGITFDLDQTVDQAMTAGAELATFTRYNPFEAKGVALSMSVDQAKLQAWLDETFVTEDQRSAPASVAYDAEQKTFLVQSARVGAQADAAAVAQALAAGQGLDSPLTVPTVPEPPAITDDAAQQVADAANRQVTATYLLKAGNAKYTLPAEVLAGWLVFTPDPAAGTIHTSVDEAKAAAELPALVTQNLTKEAVPEQILVGPSGQVLGVQQHGANGTSVADPAGVSAAVIAALKTGEGIDLEVGITTQPFTSQNVPMADKYLVPGGEKWVEVNLGARTVTRWEGTSQVSTWSVVIGKPSTPTTPGVYHVQSKIPLQDMEGADYLQPDVPWIAYFNGDQALHGNYWASMGQAASHGCVGITPDLAKVMYDWISVGTLVVVHG